MRKAVSKILKRWGSKKLQPTHPIEITDLSLKGSLKTHFRWLQMKTITNKEFYPPKTRGEPTQKKAGIVAPPPLGLRQLVPPQENLLPHSWKGSRPKPSTVLDQTSINLCLREPKSYKRSKNKPFRKKNMIWRYSQKFQGPCRKNKISSQSKKGYMEEGSHSQTCTRRKKQ